eukprot:1161681-Pelagomonas_calceolata.AAC.6
MAHAPLRHLPPFTMAHAPQAPLCPPWPGSLPWPRLHLLPSEALAPEPHPPQIRGPPAFLHLAGQGRCATLNRGAPPRYGQVAVFMLQSRAFKSSKQEDFSVEACLAAWARCMEPQPRNAACKALQPGCDGSASTALKH